LYFIKSIIKAGEIEMKKNKLRLLIFSIFTFIIFITACKRNATDECEKPLNPNGDSELALLMRNMNKHLSTERKLLSEKKLPGNYPSGFETIRTAKPSDTKSKSENFNSFALMYLMALKQYHESTSIETAKGNYNNLVKTCVSCHVSECPGPVKTIEKNYIN
jgi:hypothetical protein